MIQIAFLFLFCTGVLAQVPGFGACPKVEVKQNFEVSKYLGVWYEYEKYFAIFELGGKCITANYTLNSDGSVKVVNRQINSLTGNPSSIEGTATFSGNKTEAKLSVVFSSVPLKIPGPYWVLDTDYENFAVVLSCSDLGFVNGKIVWVLTRKQEPTQSIVETAHEVLKKNNLSVSALMKTDQKNCTLTS